MYDTDSVTIEFASGAHLTRSLRPNWDEREALEATLSPPPTVRPYIRPRRFAGKRKLAAWRVAEDERAMQNAAHRLWDEDRNALITIFADSQYASLLDLIDRADA